VVSTIVIVHGVADPAPAKGDGEHRQNEYREASGLFAGLHGEVLLRLVSQMYRDLNALLTPKCG